jgi:hypothetical protein
MHGQMEAEQRARRIPEHVDTRTTAFIIVWSVERSISEHVRAAGPRADAAFARALARAAWVMIFATVA